MIEPIRIEQTTRQPLAMIRLTVPRAEMPRVARTTDHGDYGGLGAAWGTFMQAVADAALTPADELWEQYVAGPDSGLPPSAWRTELTRPLLDS